MAAPWACVAVNVLFALATATLYVLSNGATKFGYVIAVYPSFSETPDFWKSAKVKNPRCFARL